LAVGLIDQIQWHLAHKAVGIAIQVRQAYVLCRLLQHGDGPAVFVQRVSDLLDVEDVVSQNYVSGIGNRLSQRLVAAGLAARFIPKNIHGD